jgi:HEAT repeat protein
MPHSTEKFEGSDHDLVTRALTITDPDDSERFRTISELQHRGGRSILSSMLELCDSLDEKQQSLGLDVLGQLGVASGETFVEESIPTVIRLCEETDSLEVLQSGIAALGHMHDPQGLPVLLANVDHVDEGVRYYVASALPWVVEDSVDPAVIEALIKLMKDTSPLVRDWATFSLGTMLNEDNPVIREALWARADDEDPETIFEALRGLGSRHASGVVGRIIDLLNRPDVSSYYVDAAVAVPDRRLVEPLKALLARGWVDTDITSEWLKLVIDGCENVD